jgi:uncharacterized membrane protein
VQASARRITLICAAQAVIYAASWLWAADELRRAVDHRVLRVAGPLVLLGLSLTPELMLWTVTIGTESLSIALVVATIAGLLQLIRTRTRGAVVTFTVLIVLDAFTRDTNVVLAITVAVVAIVIAVRQAPLRTGALVVAFVCLLAAVVSNRMASGADPPRWYFPLQDVVVVRVLPHADARDFFAARGMPVNAELMGVARNYVGEYQALTSAPQFAKFRSWLRNKGLATYESYLVRHPLELAREPFNGRSDILEPSVTGAILVSGGRARPARVFGVLGWLTFWRDADVILLWSGGAVVAGAWLAVRRRRDPLLLLALVAVVATAVAHAGLAFLGDALEVGRHAITADAQWRAGLWILTFVVLDRILVRAATGSEDEVEPRSGAPLGTLSSSGA